MTTTSLGHVTRTTPRRPVRWHRPLLGLAALMGALAVAATVLAVVDPREILGQNAWFKPLKFALSIAIYSVTLAWLIGMLQRFERAGRWAGTVAVGALAVESVIITWAAAVGTTSHFNVSSPLHAVLWEVMGASIVLVWLMTMVVGIALWISRVPDRARSLTVKAGIVLALIGMALAFLMTQPQSYQLDDFEGVVGAHAVGVPDGGPGLPLLGWSTEGGDLRVPHFIGMHAPQILMLTLLALDAAGRRLPALRRGQVRYRLMVVATSAFAGFLTIVTWQALIGESVTAPSRPIVAAAAAIGTLTVLAALMVLIRRRPPGDREPTD